MEGGNEWVLPENLIATIFTELDNGKDIAKCLFLGKTWRNAGANDQATSKVYSFPIASSYTVTQPSYLPLHFVLTRIS